MALERAWQQGPAPVRVAADLACVGHAAARYTASRMVDCGQLVVIRPGKPAVLALHDAVRTEGGEQQCPLMVSLDLIDSVMWGGMR
jgi:hypothetical protein